MSDIDELRMSDIDELRMSDIDELRMSDIDERSIDWTKKNGRPKTHKNILRAS